jgi:CHAD domain-containing protein
LHEPGARLGDDPEELHDFRLAARRLDAVLRQFRSFLPEALLRIRPTLKAIIRALGEVRDLDVALSELESFCRELPRADRDGAAPLRQHWMSERARARARMLGVLDSVWVQKSFQEWSALLAGAPAASPAPELAIDAAPQMIRRRYRKVCKQADALTSDSSAHAHHEVRAQVKKLRYALEAVSGIYGKPADEMLRALRRWQDRLGVQQDAAIASERLKSLAGAPGAISAESLFLMGRFAEYHESAALRARKLHPKGYRKVRARFKKLQLKLGGAAAQEMPRPVRPMP